MNSMKKAKGKKGPKERGKSKFEKLIMIIIVYFNQLNYSASHYPIWRRKVMWKKGKNNNDNNSKDSFRVLFIWIRLILLKIKNWKHCNKIIFKCVNSNMVSIFNEKVIEKWSLWFSCIVHKNH